MILQNFIGGVWKDSTGVHTVSAKLALVYIGFVPLIDLLFMPWIIETKGRVLPD